MPNDSSLCLALAGTFTRQRYRVSSSGHGISTQRVCDPGVTAVYDRHSYDREKRDALDAWAIRLVEILQCVGTYKPKTLFAQLRGRLLRSKLAGSRSARIE